MTDTPGSVHVYAEYIDLSGCHHRVHVGLIPMHESNAFHITGIVGRIEKVYQQAINDTP